MSFLYKTNILIQNLNDEMYLFDLDKDVLYTKLDSNLNKLSSEKLIEGDFSFVDLCLDIDNENNIYGVINNKKGKLINIDIKDDVIDTSLLFKYDYKNFFIKFPYFKKVNTENHIIYYLVDKKSPYSTTLIHLYKSDDKYVKNKIDYLNYNIMTNFIVTIDNDIPTIFYFKHINDFEELFMSTFDLSTLKWSTPYQITNSKKNKIYLTVLKDINNTYHIAFSENNNNKYYCKYINGNISNEKFQINKESFISHNLMCVFPTLIEQNSNIYIQWVEYFNLYMSKSDDYGNTWSSPLLDENISNSSFILYKFNSMKSNINTTFGIRNYSYLKHFFPFNEFKL